MPSNQILLLLMNFFFYSCLVYRNNFLLSNRGETGSHLVSLMLLGGSLEVNSTWIITSDLSNQRARKVLFTCVVYINRIYNSAYGMNVITLQIPRPFRVI